MSLKVEKAHAISWAAVLLLSALFALPAAGSPAAAQAQLNHVSDTLLEIHGGAGRQSWVIRYGSNPEFGPKAQLVSAGSNRAWFSHGGWLRLIDTEKGVVVGRWHLPGEIVGLTPVESKVQATIEARTLREPVRKTISLDPVSGTGAPYRPNEYLLLSRVPNYEVSIWKVGKNQDLMSGQKLSADDESKKLLPELEEAARRDPDSPWLQVVYARLLRILGDPQAGKAFDHAVQVPSTDYTELLTISGFLDRIGERDAARAAFERGYANFFEQGNDPRLLLTLIYKLVLYYPWAPEPATVNLTDPYYHELMERTYRVTPRCEGADLAWAAYADYLEKNGRADEAPLWRARAEDASQTSLLLLPRRVTLFADRLILVICGSLIAAGLYVIILWIGYRPQRRVDSADYQEKNALVRTFSRLNFQYWSRSQRVALLTILLVAWVATGWEVATLAWILRAAAAPESIASGSLAGPATVAYLESHQPKTPYQDLFLAVGYQQSGENEKAERLYRALPDFAESWNNLGVLQKVAGKDQDARQSFEHALELDPNLNEAALNLGQPPRDLWTELHQKYLAGRPMLAPPRVDRMGRMFLGISFTTAVVIGALSGPLFGFWLGYGNSFSLAALVGEQPLGLDPMSRVVSYVLIAALVFSVILVFLRPTPATRKTGTLSTVLEFLFPGVSPAWGIVGGLVLVAWCQFLLADYFLFAYSSPDIMTFISVPNLEKAYRVPGALAYTLKELRPSLVWVYLAPALLLAVNGLLMIRSRLARRNP